MFYEIGIKNFLKNKDAPVEVYVGYIYIYIYLITVKVIAHYIKMDSEIYIIKLPSSWITSLTKWIIINMTSFFFLFLFPILVHTIY